MTPATHAVRLQHGVAMVGTFGRDWAAPWHGTLNVSLLQGPPPSTESYLNIEAVVAAMKQTGADAVHPGYGFLSENSHFAQAVEDAGAAFVGPPASAVLAMGDKVRGPANLGCH